MKFRKGEKKEESPYESSFLLLDDVNRISYKKGPPQAEGRTQSYVVSVSSDKPLRKERQTHLYQLTMTSNPGFLFIYWK